MKNKFFTREICVCVHLTQTRYAQKTCAEMRINMNDNNTDINASVASVVSSPDTFSKEDIHYMKLAIKQAKKATLLDEVPIGCIIVYNGKIIGRGYNRRNTDKTTLGHAEITAIKKASRYMNDWRLEDCTIYVTLEPCQMCAGAIVQARIPRVVIGSMNSKAGCAGSIINLLNMPQFNHQAEVVRGVCDEECSTMLSTFFRELRQKKKAEKEAGKEALKETPASQNIRI